VRALGDPASQRSSSDLFAAGHHGDPEIDPASGFLPVAMAARLIGFCQIFDEYRAGPDL